MNRVIELGLVIALCVTSVLIAAYQVRNRQKHQAQSPDALRLLGAVERACSAFLGRETQLLVPVVIAIAAVLTGLVALHERSGGLIELAGPAVATVLGAAICTRLAYFSLRQALTASLNGLHVKQTKGTPEQMLTQSASWTAVTTDATALLVVVASFAALYGYAAGGNTLTPGAAAWKAALGLPCLALGAIGAGAIFQIGGNSFQTATSVASAAARATRPQLVEQRELNPGLVAEFAGGFVGTAVSRTTDALCSALLGNMALILLAAGMVRHSDSSNQVLSCIALPLILKGIGLLSCSLVSFTIRLDHGLGTARIALSAIFLSGLVGTLLWLFGIINAAYLCASGALGLVAGLCANLLTSNLNAPVDRQLKIVQSALNADGARAMGVGLQRTVRPLLLVALCLGGAWFVGGLLDVGAGRSLGLTIGLAAMLGCNSLHHCTSLLSPLAEAITQLAGVLKHKDSSQSDAKPTTAEQFDSRCWTASHEGQTQRILAGAACALVVGLTIPSLAQAPDSLLALASTATVQTFDAYSSGHPALLFAGFLGAACLLFHVGGVLRLSSRAALRVGSDLLTHLGHNDKARVSGIRPPAARGYRASVELAAEASTDSVLPVVLLAVAAPLALAMILEIVGDSQYTALAARGLMMFATLATLTGCLASLASHGALSTLTAPFNSGHPPSSDPSGSRDSGEPSIRPAGLDSLPSTAAFLGRSVSPAAFLGLEATLAASLAVTQFLL